MPKNSKLTAFLLGFPSFLLALAFILIGLHQNEVIQNKEANSFQFQKESISIQGVGSSSKIPYDTIQFIQLLDEIETLEPIDDAYFNGICETKNYGDANAYVYPKVKSYILIKTKKKTYILNEATKKETQTLYQKLKKQVN